MTAKFFFIGFILVFVVQARAQNNWDNYKPRTLDEFTSKIIPAFLKDPDVVITNKDKKPDIVLSYGAFPSQVELSYQGDSRKISVARREVIEAWGRVLGKDKAVIDLFQDEYLFKEGQTEYWLPVQKQVAAYFPKELKKNDTVTAYVACIGGRYVEKKFDTLYLLNEFDK